MNGIEKINIEKNNNQTFIKILIDKNYDKELQVSTITDLAIQRLIELKHIGLAKGQRVVKS
ncbi:hypothetical protein SAMN02745227_01473 [Anaerobranca californiensis DSM 14826]|jgi:hypothetical protein|uniref:Uncharacterized protein n=1 Tax=Anaerobranca californiensis DSM 14826 TaxID=1120989 RepID=A0A1M6PKP1_9FIRM|nr:hypothetical protein [Anaerobranca californiensis]SHK08455.1 hypothetical protein SAMN02745227_01473 [Anaerobranca californiensis DSM 14826]